MGPWKKFESTVVRLKRSYEDTGSVVCLTTKGRQLERNFEELKPASHGINIFIHTKKISRSYQFTRFKQFNGEKKTATKTSNMFKIVPRLGTCDAGFSSSKLACSVSVFVSDFNNRRLTVAT
jgi:hypothetical protein